MIERKKNILILQLVYHRYPSNKDSRKLDHSGCELFGKTIYNKTIIEFGFCDILNYQGLGKCYQPWASADNSYLDLDNFGYHRKLIQ
jgi:hypothetical protein